MMSSTEGVCAKAQRAARAAASSSLIFTSLLVNTPVTGGGMQRFGLLLGHAVERAESPDQLGAVDSGYLAAGERLGEYPQRHPVVRIIECRHQDQTIGDVEVSVACRQPLAGKD